MSVFKHKSDVRIEGNLLLPNETGSRALIVNGSNEVDSSATTSAELAFLSGTTSSVQTQLNDIATDVADLVTLSGVAANATTLGTFTGTIIPDNSDVKEALQALETGIESLPDPIVYQGTYNATTNTPTLSNSDTGVSGYLYQVNVAGTQDFGAGNISFEVGDKVVNNGTIWEKWDMTDAVASVNGQTGVVVLDSDDISEGATNLYFTDERAQDAVGTILTDSSKIDFTYDDGTPSITATIVADSLVNADINSAAAIARTKLASGSNDHVVINNGSGVMSSEALLNVSRGGTGVSGASASNGQLLIGNGSGYALSTLTAGTNISITNGAGSITINATGTTGDISLTSFSAANNQAAAANVTGLAFANGVVRSFEALVSVTVDATSDLFEVFTLRGVQRGSDWDLNVTSNGDDSGHVFSITNAGQIQYQNLNYAGFVSSTMSFRAIITAV